MINVWKLISVIADLANRKLKHQGEHKSSDLDPPVYLIIILFLILLILIVLNQTLN